MAVVNHNEAHHQAIALQCQPVVAINCTAPWVATNKNYRELDVVCFPHDSDAKLGFVRIGGVCL